MTISRRQWIWTLALCAPAAAFSQERFRHPQRIEGKVVDENGRPVSGANVKLKNVQNKMIRSYISQNAGDFQFTGLTTATAYEIWAEHRGRRSDTEYLSRFDTAKVLRVELKLDK